MNKTEFNGKYSDIIVNMIEKDIQFMERIVNAKKTHRERESSEAMINQIGRARQWIDIIKGIEKNGR